MKKKSFLLAIALAFLTACDGWVYVVPTFPAPPPTLTPRIYSPTPVFWTATATAAVLEASVTPTSAVLPAPSDTATAFLETPTFTALPAASPIPGSLTVEVLGCNTSVDITHGMGEVTNAFVVLKNASGSDFTELCTTLFAYDEGRVHPDKTVCLPSLRNNFQIILKLTVDSTYKKDTPIQVEVKQGDALLTRIGQDSCKDIGLFAPAPTLLLTPVAIP